MNNHQQKDHFKLYKDLWDAEFNGLIRVYCQSFYAAGMKNSYIAMAVNDGVESHDKVVHHLQWKYGLAVFSDYSTIGILLYGIHYNEYRAFCIFHNIGVRSLV